MNQRGHDLSVPLIPLGGIEGFTEIFLEKIPMNQRIPLGGIEGFTEIFLEKIPMNQRIPLGGIR
jgi:hypothetical protein